MKHKNALFKIGGKILEDLDNLNSTISQLGKLSNSELIQKIILVPGGGSFANFIRNAYKELKFNDELAHWMGIISMNYNGIELNKKFPELKIYEDLDSLKKSNESFCIFLPLQFLKENDELPHSWDATSDSISLFIAKKLGLNECFLIKDVDGILNDKNEIIKDISTMKLRNMIKSGELAELKLNNQELKAISEPIDAYLTTLIDKYKIPCIILNGSKNKTRILEYFNVVKKEKQFYTKIN